MTEVNEKSVRRLKQKERNAPTKSHLQKAKVSANRGSSESEEFRKYHRVSSASLDSFCNATIPDVVHTPVSPFLRLRTPPCRLCTSPGAPSNPPTPILFSPCSSLSSTVHCTKVIIFIICYYFANHKICVKRLILHPRMFTIYISHSPFVSMFFLYTSHRKPKYLS